MIARMRWRRLFQVRLRTLLLVVVPGLALVGGWLQPALKQQRAVEELRQRGALVVYEHDPDASARFPSIQTRTGHWWPPAWLVSRLGDDYFFSAVAVEQWNSQWGKAADGDAILAACSQLRDLRELRIGNSPVTDRGLAHLKSLRKLESLEICNPEQQFHRVTDDGMAALGNLTSLRCLVIGPAELTDRTLAIVGRLRELRRLELSGYAFTDAGLVQLVDCKQLTSLSLLGEFTGPAVAELQALPRLELLSLSRLYLKEGEFGPLVRFPALTYLRINGANCSAALKSSRVASTENDS